MKKIPLFILLLVSGAESSLAAKAYSCDMKWNLLTEGSHEQKFHLESSAETTPFAHTRVIVENKDKLQSISIIQSYGEKDQNHVQYHLACSGTEHCIGFRETLADGKNRDTPLQIIPLDGITAKIGQRKIFQYQRKKKGIHCAIHSIPTRLD